MKTWLRLTLITMTVGGGFTGVVFTVVGLHSYFSSQNQKPFNLLVLLLFLMLNAGVTASGLLFVHDPRRTQLLVAALAIQVPRISSPLVAYKFATGLEFVLSVGGPAKAEDPGVHLGWNFFFGSSWAFSFLQEHPFSVGINLSALAMLILLVRSARTPASPMKPESLSTGDQADSAAVPSGESTTY